MCSSPLAQLSLAELKQNGGEKRVGIVKQQ